MKHTLSWVIFLLTSALSYAQTCPNKLPASSPNDDFHIHSDGTVTHLRTELMWSRCSLGQTLKEDRCVGEASEVDWSFGTEAATTSTLAGYNDWRLPDITEIETLIERACYDPAINLTVFPNTPSLFYWSNTPDIYGPGPAWRLFFYYGDIYYYSYKHNQSAVRLVRNVK
ncbi:DUF1566 domain-containing protein [Reinekea forsetii]|nr:DUF1566 domain-containing protein [Reinekea forsetii]